jgi:protein-tyrosine-phosphatase/DNA-binding transcriptional ArsR family regulator
MSVSSLDLAAPPTLLQLAGHPLRWRLLGELARSDRIVHELTALVGEAQNLVSYHLGKLRSAGLVRARRSAADGRDTYYALDLPRLEDLLRGAGAALHPGLRLARPAYDAEAIAPGRVLFLCTGNSARSQMAEALAVSLSGGAVRAWSAGSRPKPLHRLAVEVLRAQGIDIAGRRSKHLDEFAERRFDRVITLCDRVREVCPEFPGGPATAHWSIPDPAREPGGEAAMRAAFERVADELAARIGFLLAAIRRAA